MRTDVKIDNRAVACPNASTLGFGEYKCKTGDVINFMVESETAFTGRSHNQEIARSIGRITTLGGKVFILALRLSHGLDSCHECWVNPKDVTRIERPDRSAAFMAWFMQPKLPYKADLLRKLAEHGTLNGSYIDKVETRARELNR